LKSDAYKNTDIGKIPLEWKVKRLGDEDISKIRSGGTPSRSKPEYFLGNIPWVKSGELEDGQIFDTEEKITLEALNNSAASIFPKGTLLMAMYGATVGKTGILAIDAATNQAVCAIVPRNESFFSNFLQYLLIQYRPQLLNARYGGAQPNISQTVVKNLFVSLPPFDEQRTIAAILSKIQQAIEVQEKIIERTKELKKTLMAKLFTEGLHVEELKETDIGQMPRGWEVVTIGSLTVDGIMNGAFVKNPLWGNGTRFLNVVDTYRSEQVNVDLLMRLEVSDGFKRNYALKNKDVLFVRSSLKEKGVGQPCFVDGLVEPVIYDCHLMKLSPKLEMVDPLYLVLYCLSEHGKKRLIANSNKTTMTTINQKGLSDFTLPLAPLAEQKEIVHIAERLNAKLLVHQYKLTKWQGLFNSMLHQLMTGQIRTNHTEIPFDA
jgi:type I restriction enzyme S subunit